VVLLLVLKPAREGYASEVGLRPKPIREDNISPRSNPGDDDAGRGQESQLSLPSLDSRMVECRCWKIITVMQRRTDVSPTCLENAHMYVGLIYVSSREPSVAVRDSDTQARVEEDDWQAGPQIRG
jgi:hypothetical protein